VNPRLVLLTGVPLSEFTDRYGIVSRRLRKPIRDDGVGHVVFDAARATLRHSTHEVLVVQLAHASQFGWTYAKYKVVRRILKLLRVEQI